MPKPSVVRTLADTYSLLSELVYSFLVDDAISTPLIVMLFSLSLSAWIGAMIFSIICSFTIYFHWMILTCLLPSFTSCINKVCGHGSFPINGVASDHLLSSNSTCNAQSVLVYSLTAYVFIFNVQSMNSLSRNCFTPSL